MSLWIWIMKDGETYLTFHGKALACFILKGAGWPAERCVGEYSFGFC